MGEGRIDPTTWAYKDGVRAALAGEPRNSNPCDPGTEAARSYQWFAGYDAAIATPTALPSAEDALREAVRLAALEEAAMIAQTFGVPGGHIGDTARAVAVAIRRRAALQSPRASDEVCAACGGPAWVEHTGSIMPGIGVPCDCDAIAAGEKALSASPVPVDASGVGDLEPSMALSVLDDFARKDGWGSARMRFHENDIPLIVEAMVAYGAERLAEALSHTAPVADAQAGEGFDV